VHPAALHGTFDEALALIRVLRRYSTLSSPPGTKFRYSNIGYWLLGPIIERASGVPFPQYVRDRVLQPLGIPPAELGYAISGPHDHAKGYLEKYSLLNMAKRLVVAGELIGDYEGRWLHLRDHYVNGAAFGGLVGSASGVATFLEDQLRPHSALFADSTRRLFYEPQVVSDGTEIPMTLGWHIGSVRGIRYFYKEGGGGGFHSMMRLYPSAAIGTVVIVNATGFDVRGHLDSVDALFL
jgi:CubicO group peptidase (beta-lactamase class C family)